MDKKAIRAKAVELRHLVRTEILRDEALEGVEAALTQAWNEAVEAAAEIPYLEGIGPSMVLQDLEKAIRRLRIEGEGKAKGR